MPLLDVPSDTSLPSSIPPTRWWDRIPRHLEEALEEIWLARSLLKVGADLGLERLAAKVVSLSGLHDCRFYSLSVQVDLVDEEVQRPTAGQPQCDSRDVLHVQPTLPRSNRALSVFDKRDVAGTASDRR
jgi:hypothetical protein